MLYHTKSVFSYLFKHSIRFTKRKRHCIIFFQSWEEPLSVTEHDLWRLRHYISLPVTPTLDFSDFLFNECHCCKIYIIKNPFVWIFFIYLCVSIYLERKLQYHLYCCQRGKVINRWKSAQRMIVFSMTSGWIYWEVFLTNEYTSCWFQLYYTMKYIIFVTKYQRVIIYSIYWSTMHVLLTWVFKLYRQ